MNSDYVPVFMATLSVITIVAIKLILIYKSSRTRKKTNK